MTILEVLQKIMKTSMEVMFGSRKQERRKNSRVSCSHEYGSMGYILSEKEKSPNHLRDWFIKNLSKLLVR